MKKLNVELMQNNIYDEYAMHLGKKIKRILLFESISLGVRLALRIFKPCVIFIDFIFVFLPCPCNYTPEIHIFIHLLFITVFLIYVRI